MTKVKTTFMVSDSNYWNQFINNIDSSHTNYIKFIKLNDNRISMVNNCIESKPHVIVLSYNNQDELNIIKEIINSIQLHNKDIKIIVIGLIDDELNNELFNQEYDIDYFISYHINPNDLMKRIACMINNPFELYGIMKSNGSGREFINPTHKLYSNEYANKITVVLRKLMMSSTHTKGYHYLRTSILLSIYDTTHLSMVSKCLYPVVAQIYDTTWNRVERAIRHQIFTGFTQINNKSKDEKINIMKLLRVYNVDDLYIPTVGEFITLLTDNFKLGLYDNISE